MPPAQQRKEQGRGQNNKITYGRLTANGGNVMCERPGWAAEHQNILCADSPPMRASWTEAGTRQQLKAVRNDHQRKALKITRKARKTCLLIPENGENTNEVRAAAGLAKNWQHRAMENATRKDKTRPDRERAFPLILLPHLFLPLLLLLLIPLSFLLLLLLLPVSFLVLLLLLLLPRMGVLTASALALNFLGFTTTMRPLPPSHVTILEPFSRSISGLTRTATLKALRSRVRFPPPVEARDDSSRDSSVLLKIQKLQAGGRTRLSERCKGNSGTLAN